MNKKPKLKPSIKIVTSALAAGGFIIGSTAGATTSSSAFDLEELNSGYMVADSHGDKDMKDAKDKEGMCGEGKCGEGMCGEGKGMGEHKHAKDMEGSCGEGKCGEGMCGEGKGMGEHKHAKDMEGSCGEGKCGN